MVNRSKCYRACTGDVCLYDLDDRGYSENWLTITAPDTQTFSHKWGKATKIRNQVINEHNQWIDIIW